MHRPEPDNTPSVYPGDVFREPLNHRLQRLCRSLKSCLQMFGIISLFIIIVFINVLIIFGPLALPDSPAVTVKNAYLTRFNMTAASPAGSDNYTLDFNLTVEFRLRNGNLMWSVCYRALQSDAYYRSQWLTLAKVPDFCQGRKRGSTTTVSFLGRTSAVLRPREVGFFGNEARAGFFLVDMSVKGKGKFRLHRVRYKESFYVMCLLKVPLLAGGPSPAGGGTFPTVKC